MNSLLSTIFLHWSIWIYSPLEDHWWFGCFGSTLHSQRCNRQMGVWASNPLSLLVTVVADHTSHLEKRWRRQPPALCWRMSPVVATTQPMQLGALAVKSALGLDSSESCHRDLQGRLSKKINGCYLPCPSACSGLYQRLYFISPSFSLLFCSIRNSPKDPPSKLPRSLEGAHLEAMRYPSASAEMWIKKCCSTAKCESSCLSNTRLWSPWWLGQAPQRNDLGKSIFLSPYLFLVTSKCLPLTILLLQPRSGLHFKDKATHRGPRRLYFIPNCNDQGGNSTTRIWQRCHSPWEITLFVKRETEGLGKP